VQNKNYATPDYTSEEVYDRETGIGHTIKIVPIKDMKSLTITWPCMPD
jgi:hypothetical protein